MGADFPLRRAPVVPIPGREQGLTGRGASTNIGNRFERLASAPDEEWNHAEDPGPQTVLFEDATSSLLTTNDSPDIGFEVSFNPYRGCEHGCIYCYARPTHEYLGWSAGLDFESRILVKSQAPLLLRRELSAPTWKPQLIMASGVTDCYQPVERRLRLTRSCLEVLSEFRNPVSIITKSALVTRDIDVLGQLARHQAASVTLSVTTLRQDLSLALEPRAAVPAARLQAIAALAAAGIPVGVNLCPIIPGLTDHEIPAILKACAAAGARWAGYGLVRLPHAVAPLFEQWLGEKQPAVKDKVLARIREVRDGRLNDARFGTRRTGEGIYARQIASLMEVQCRRHGLDGGLPELSTASFQSPAGRQLSWLSDAAEIPRRA